MSFWEKVGNSILYSNFFFIFEKTAYFQRVKNGHHGGILKIMILHCPSTHKHRLVLILASSFCIHRSPLEVTVKRFCFSSNFDKTWWNCSTKKVKNLVFDNCSKCWLMMRVECTFIHTRVVVVFFQEKCKFSMINFLQVCLNFSAWFQTMAFNAVVGNKH